MLIPGITSHIVAGAAAYEPDAVYFDGSNDYFYRSGFSASDAKTITFSCWAYFATSGASEWLFYAEESNLRGAIYKHGTSDKLRLYWENSSGTKILDQYTTNTLPIGEWVHIMLSVDMASTSHIYINGVDDAAAAGTFTNQNLDLTPSRFCVGSRYIASPDPLYADLAEVWFDDSYMDLSSSSNRAKFISGSGSGATPVDLGSSGENPTGSSPLLCMSGNASTWNSAGTNNKGTGGGMTVVGAVADSSNEPVEVP